MSNQQTPSGIWVSPMPHHEKLSVHNLYTLAEYQRREITWRTAQFQREKKFAAKMALLCALAILSGEKLEKKSKGLLAWGWMVVKGLKEKVERLEGKRHVLVEKVSGLGTKKGKMEMAYRALSLLSTLWEAAAQQEGGKVAGLERVASLYKEKLISKTKENAANAEMVKTLEAKLKLLEEMNGLKEEETEVTAGLNGKSQVSPKVQNITKAEISRSTLCTTAKSGVFEVIQIDSGVVVSSV